MKSKSKSEEEKALDLKIKESFRWEKRLNDVQRVVSALKKSKEDFAKAEKILEDKWGKEKAKNMLELYHHFMDKDSVHPDSKQSLLSSINEIKNLIKQNK